MKRKEIEKINEMTREAIKAPMEYVWKRVSNGTLLYPRESYESLNMIAVEDEESHGFYLNKVYEPFHGELPHLYLCHNTGENVDVIAHKRLED